MTAKELKKVEPITIPVLLNAVLKVVDLFNRQPSASNKVRYIRRKMRLIKRIKRKVRKGKLTELEGQGLIDELNSF